jgi:hypothetical protein
MPPESSLDLKQQFSMEGRSTSWAPTTEARILDEVAQVDRLSLTTLNVECRETVCELRMTFPSGDDLSASRESLLALEQIDSFRRVVSTVVMGPSPEANFYFERAMNRARNRGDSEL